MFIHDRTKDQNALDANQPLRPAEPPARPKEASGPGLYPQGQVTRLIMETAARNQEEEEEAGDRRTPVDLQDIVEKLNNAIRDAKSNMNTVEADLSPMHNKS